VLTRDRPGRRTAGRTANRAVTRRSRRGAGPQVTSTVVPGQRLRDRPGRRRRRRRARRIGLRLVRAAVMIALVGVLGVGVISAWGPGSRTGVRFTSGAPSAPTTGLGSLVARAVSSRAGSRASRSGVVTFASLASPSLTTVVPPPVVTPTATGRQPAPCHVSYAVTAGAADTFTGLIVIANTSAVPVNGWTLRWDSPPSQHIVSASNATVTNGPAGAVATDLVADALIAPGSSVTIGFQGHRDSQPPAPTGFTLNGAACAWEPAVALPVVPASGQPVTASPSSPPPTTTGSVATPTGSVATSTGSVQTPAESGSSAAGSGNSDR
jgi:Cellulose binding domain